MAAILVESFKEFRPVKTLFITALCLSIATGCSQQSKEKQLAETPLKGRLEAALAITDPSSKNDALKSVALDAATAKNTEVVIAALQKISDPSLKNATAATCALKLAEQGETKEATATAAIISDPSQKNDVLSRIAKGTH